MARNGQLHALGVLRLEWMAWKMPTHVEQSEVRADILP